MRRGAQGVGTDRGEGAPALGRIVTVEDDDQERVGVVVAEKVYKLLPGDNGAELYPALQEDGSPHPHAGKRAVDEGKVLVYFFPPQFGQPIDAKRCRVYGPPRGRRAIDMCTCGHTTLEHVAGRGLCSMGQCTCPRFFPDPQPGRA